MLEPMRHTLDFQRIILASSSSRRREILHLAGLRFEVRPSLFNEDLDPSKFPNHADYAVETAYRKVLDVAERLSSDPNKPDIIIGADTVISLDGRIYGKPNSPKEAEKFLEELSGRQHTVHTGVVIKTQTATVKFHESCNVYMTYLNDDIIRGYVRTREPVGKAGAYAIQGYGGSLIERIDGDYYTVMGLPLHSLCKHLVWLMEDRVRRMEMTRALGPQTTSSVLQNKEEKVKFTVKERSKSKERESVDKTPMTSFRIKVEPRNQTSFKSDEGKKSKTPEHKDITIKK